MNRRVMSLRSAGVWLLAGSLALLAAPAGTYAGSREAVQKAIAATVAVEWRAEEKANKPPPGGSASVRHVPENVKGVAEAEPGGRPAVIRARRITAVASQRADLALASGVVVSANGLVVTFNPEPDGRYDVVFADGRSLPARVVVDDRRSGLRLLKVDAADLPHLSLADAEAELGDQVFAAFCTDRHERAAARGMIAAPHTGGTVDLDLAAGLMSNGGGIVNEQGGLVGILAGRRTPTGNSAVPLADVRALLAAQQGENTVVVHRGFLGVQLEGKPEGGRERVIVRLLADSPARTAGMLDGDELVTVAGQKISSMSAAAAAVARHSPGEKIGVVVLRDGQEKPLEIIVGRLPDSMESVQDAGLANLRRSRVAASVVHPEQLYVLSEDGKQVAVLAEGQQVEALRNYARALRFRATAESPYQAPGATASAIRVERTDLDKKLEEVGRSVESLHEQVKKLTEEIQALRSKLAEGK